MTTDAREFIRRRERELGRGYVVWVGTAEGQTALRAAAEEDAAARRPHPDEARLSEPELYAAHRGAARAPK